MAPPNAFDVLATAVDDLTTIVGKVGTDASVLKRINAGSLTRRLGEKGLFHKERNATIDLPSGRSGSLKVLLLEREAMPRAFERRQVDRIVECIGTVMAAEMPVILPRWAFDQVMRTWLGEMQLSASMVLSNQRTVVMVERNLMVRVSKMVSDPRSQMVSLREQTVRNLETETDPRSRRPFEGSALTAP